MSSYFQNIGYCQVELNNAGCGFDWGDCCGPDVKPPDCSECECLGENLTSRAAPGPFCSCSVKGAIDCKLICFIKKSLKQTTFYFIFQGCETPELVDNDVCNDEANTAECNYDGGNQGVHSISLLLFLYHSTYFDSFSITMLYSRRISSEL